MLKFIQNHGNVTTYEWRTGSKPVTIQEDWVVIDTKDEEDLPQNADDVRQIFILTLKVLKKQTVFSFAEF